MAFIITYYFSYHINSGGSKNFVLGGSLKNFNKNKNLNISSYRQKKLIHEILQFSSTSFQIFNCYIIIHYEYLLPMSVAKSL